MFACLLANDYGVDMNGHVRHEPLINLLLLGPAVIPDLPCQQLSPWPRFLTDSSIYVNPWIHAQGLWFFSPHFFSLCARMEIMKGFHRNTPADVLPPILTSLREALDKTINGETGRIH